MKTLCNSEKEFEIPALIRGTKRSRRRGERLTTLCSGGKENQNIITNINKYTYSNCNYPVDVVIDQENSNLKCFHSYTSHSIPLPSNPASSPVTLCWGWAVYYSWQTQGDNPIIDPLHNDVSNEDALLVLIMLSAYSLTISVYHTLFHVYYTHQ